VYCVPFKWQLPSWAPTTDFTTAVSENAKETNWHFILTTKNAHSFATCYITYVHVTLASLFQWLPEMALFQSFGTRLWK
jgi:hypothetical protein